MTTIQSNDYDFFASSDARDSAQSPQRLNLDPEQAGQGLVKLVLSLVEMIRELLEKQALRKIERETLSAEEIEKLGISLMKLEEKMEELKTQFNLEDDDLRLDLGISNLG